MEAVLQRLPSTADRINFLQNHGCVDAAARAMVEDGRNEEASNLMRAHGKFVEAIKYSADPRFVANCWMAAARTASTDNPGILEMLKKAEELYRRCNEQNGQAEALVMLGKAEERMERLEEAGKLFNKTQNYCGACECVAAMFELANGNSPPLSAWIIVRAIERLVDLINILYKPPAKLQMADEKKLLICEEHFGLFKSDVVNLRLCYTRSGNRFSRKAPDLMAGNTSDIEVMVDITKGRPRIGDHLTDVAISLVHQTRRWLEATLLEHSVCRNHLNGFVCVTSDCKYLHTSDTTDLFNKRFTALLNLVYLDATEGTLAGITKQRKPKKEASQIHASTPSCERLYELLFPATGLRSNKVTYWQLCDLRDCQAVKKCLFSYAETVWRNSGRLSDVDTFLHVFCILELVESPSTLMDWVCQEESTLEKKIKRGKMRNVAAIRLRKDMGLVDNQSFLHLWAVGWRLLRDFGRVVDAGHHIVRRFLSLPAKRAIMFPSIANTVMILEYQLTACLALFARLKPPHMFPVCLPASYLATVQLWDDMCCTKQNHYSLYNAVEYEASSNNPQRLMNYAQSLLRYMVNLTCGKVSRDFNVVGDALHVEESASGDAERTLVLVLTMLCNCGKGIPFDCDADLLKSLWEVAPMEAYPDRVKNALEAVKDAVGIRDVVVILRKLLQSRNEKLFDLGWHNRKLWYDPSWNPSYSPTFYADLSSLRLHLQTSETSKGTTDEATEEREDLETLETPEEIEEHEPDLPQELEEEKRQEREKAERYLAAKKIQEWYRQRREFIRRRDLKRSTSKEETKDSASRSPEEHFSGFKIDVSACGICGEDFTKLLEAEEHEPGMESGNIELYKIIVIVR